MWKRGEHMAIIEQCNVQGGQRGKCWNRNGGDEWRGRDSNMGGDTGREPWQGEQCGRKQRTNNRIDELDGGRKDDWQCGIIGGMWGGRIDITGEHVDIVDGSSVSTRMGRIRIGWGSVDGWDGPDIGWGRERKHMGELRWSSGEQWCHEEHGRDRGITDDNCGKQDGRGVGRIEQGEDGIIEIGGYNVDIGQQHEREGGGRRERDEWDEDGCIRRRRRRDGWGRNDEWRVECGWGIVEQCGSDECRIDGRDECNDGGSGEWREQVEKEWWCEDWRDIK